MKKALFFDRDGTLIVHQPYLHRADDVALIPGTIEALQRARAAGYLLFLFTNQSGVGRGYFPLADVHRVHARLLELVGAGPDLFAATCIAPEHPDAPSAYRKPSPRFIQEMTQRYDLAADESWMIGDTASDWRAGRAAGISTAAVRSNLFDAEAETIALGLAVPVYANLAAFAEACLEPALAG